MLNNNIVLNYLDVFEGYSILYSIWTIDSINLIFSNNIVYMLYSLLLIYISRSLLTFEANSIYSICVRGMIGIYYFVHNLVISYLQCKNTLFFIWISFIFTYITFNNMLGIIPFSYTINSHLNITALIAFASWLGIVLIGLNNFGLKSFSLFIVSGIPKQLIFFLACIELLSYLFRFLSLSLRLFANIVAGHILLETVYIFLFKILFITNNNKIINILIFLLPVSFFIVLILFEMIISFLQGYIFIVLVLIYLKDSLLLH